MAMTGGCKASRSTIVGAQRRKSPPPHPPSKKKYSLSLSEK
nr:MAG TPA: hypothetical protein [Caudoviricetes sp.]